MAGRGVIPAGSRSGLLGWPPAGGVGGGGLVGRRSEFPPTHPDGGWRRRQDVVLRLTPPTTLCLVAGARGSQRAAHPLTVRR